MTRSSKPAKTPPTAADQSAVAEDFAGAESQLTPVNAAGLTFGEAMERLEGIVTQLEENEALGLEQALAIYEQGLALAGDCRQRLATASLRLTEIAVAAPGA